jgi:TetR/AcrR family transcriptional repressor of mexJK operon
VEAEGGARSERKRAAILAAATDLFLQQGYAGTSMDEIAARAAVSKQTVYKHFADKEQLFSTIILSTTAQAAAFAEAVPQLLPGSGDLERELRALAHRYLRVVLEPRVLQLRRLIIAEARHFPALARTYYARAPERVVAALASALQRYAGRGLVALDDPLLAANHFAFLILAIPLDKAMFCGEESSGAGGETDLDRLAEAGVRVFLAAYGDHGVRQGGPVEESAARER